MEASALCEIIYDFMGQGQGQEQEQKFAPPEQVITVEEEIAVSPHSKETDNVPHSPLPAHDMELVSQCFQSEGKDIMRALVKDKLGDYNLRGVQAGMDLLDVVSRGGDGGIHSTSKPGKMLKTRQRRHQRVEGSPYMRMDLGHEKRRTSTGSRHVSS